MDTTMDTIEANAFSFLLHSWHRRQVNGESFANVYLQITLPKQPHRVKIVILNTVEVKNCTKKLIISLRLILSMALKIGVFRDCGRSYKTCIRTLQLLILQR